MCYTQWLALHANDIGNAGLTALAAAIRSGALAALQSLDLEWNWNIGDAGMVALATAVTPDQDGKGALAKLRQLVLSQTFIGDEGMSAFAKAVSNGAHPELEKLFIDSPSAELKALCSLKSIAFD